MHLYLQPAHYHAAPLPPSTITGRTCARDAGYAPDNYGVSQHSNSSAQLSTTTPGTPLTEAHI